MLAPLEAPVQADILGSLHHIYLFSQGWKFRTLVMFQVLPPVPGVEVSYVVFVFRFQPRHQGWKFHTFCCERGLAGGGSFEDISPDWRGVDVSVSVYKGIYTYILLPIYVCLSVGHMCIGIP